jgi:hypothetical protein
MRFGILTAVVAAKEGAEIDVARALHVIAFLTVH